MLGAGTDRAPPAPVVPAPAGADRRRRALGRVPVVVAVNEAVAVAAIGGPGARLVVHTRIVGQRGDCRTP
jgi:hypothetical protein